MLKPKSVIVAAPNVRGVDDFELTVTLKIPAAGYVAWREISNTLLLVAVAFRPVKNA
jgi:hypothetical protein